MHHSECERDRQFPTDVAAISPSGEHTFGPHRPAGLTALALTGLVGFGVTSRHLARASAAAVVTGTVTVFAAASLTESFKQIGRT